MNTDITLWAYLVYLPVTIGLTWYVARTLFQNGKVFMLDIFHGKEAIAMSTNKLFETGFYLINMGFALWVLKIYNPVGTAQALVETLSYKVGGFAIYLGVMLFANLYLFFRGRRASRANAAAQNA